MIRAWSDGLNAGLLDRNGLRGATLAYDPAAAAARAVSVTMPVRLPSWNVSYGLHPIFEMNLPEGALREQIRLAFAKAIGAFDDLDLLAVVGRSQLGRLRYTAPDAELDEKVPFQSIDEVLQHRRDGDLFSYLLKRFAEHSGISGVQPKVLVRDETDAAALAQAPGRKSSSFRGATHIVKLWDPKEYPELATNEFFCLSAAVKAGLDVPRFRLAEGGDALVLDRFDLRADGTYRGIEDFCVLNGVGSAEKYRGSYEATLFKRLEQFVSSEDYPNEAEKLFTLFALNCALRNGDAHLKNFALVYDDVVAGPMRLAPIYDLVTTTAYLPDDKMALTLDGTTRWPSARKLAAVGTLRCKMTPKRVKEAMERVADAVSETAADLMRHAAEHPAFKAVGDRMLWQWAAGVEESLGSATPTRKPAKS
jgi:serine/threonine-protein kinase HipA